jgi:hypothetical protein
LYSNVKTIRTISLHQSFGRFLDYFEQLIYLGAFQIKKVFDVPLGNNQRMTWQNWFYIVNAEEIFTFIKNLIA